MFRALIERVSQQVPARCAICRAWPSRVVCNACVTRFAQPVPRCTTCALPVPEGVTRCGACLREPPPLDACLAAVNYAWPWSDCVTQFKFGHQPGWAAELATVMRSAPWVEPALEQADRVLPMPLARVQAWVMERLPGEPLMSGDNLDSMAVDNIASGKVPGLDALGITPAALAAIAPGYLRKR